jgi:hypothetical protein
MPQPAAPAPVPLPAPPPDPGPTGASGTPDRAIGDLITLNSHWHAPEFLKEAESDNVALRIGSIERLRDTINATVPTDVARPPLPVTVTIGTIVSAKLTVISSDAEVEPVDTIDKSIADDVSILFTRSVKPKVAGNLELLAFIKCPRRDGSVVTETVPLRINVHPVVKPDPSIGDRTRGFLDSLKNYWVQLVAAASLLAAAARYGSKWYGRHRPRPKAPAEATASGADIEAGADSKPGVPST